MPLTGHMRTSDTVSPSCMDSLERLMGSSAAARTPGLVKKQDLVPDLNLSLIETQGWLLRG